MLDSNPSAGKGRKLSYFDVSSAAVWVRLGDKGGQNYEHPGRVFQYLFLGVFDGKSFTG